MGCQASNVIADSTMIRDKQRFKVLVLGEAACGKTCLLTRYIRGTYDHSSVLSGVKGAEPAVGVKFLRFEKHYSIELWDIPADSIVQYQKEFAKNADGAVIMVDGSKEGSIVALRHKMKRMVSKSNREKQAEVLSSDTSPDANLETEGRDGKVKKNKEPQDSKGQNEDGDGDKNEPQVEGDGDGEVLKASSKDGLSQTPGILEEKGGANDKSMAGAEVFDFVRNLPVVIFANKMDLLEAEDRKRVEFEVDATVRLLKLNSGFTGSVASNVQINEMFDELLRAMVRRRNGEIDDNKLINENNNSELYEASRPDAKGQ
mmetsp:Transcript_2756/g.4251  ORF Transcript_2756/g.4251 Transcript_2756/m.4251 type:complete len:316 (+) Transcript_2756:97-1044(+)